MMARWLSGTPPRKTRVSVPRLMPLWSVLTRTSSTSGDRKVTDRISPVPGERSQYARAVRGIGALLCRCPGPGRFFRGTFSILPHGLNFPRLAPVLTGVRQRYAGYPLPQSGHRPALTARVWTGTFGTLV